MANGPLGLEHPLVCAGDLDRLAERYRAMGFAPAPKGLHPWGTGTQLVMFPDNFIELMGIENRDLIDVRSADGFRFGRFIADFLDRDEGIAMLALHSDDARADLAAVAARGVANAGLVDFRRAVRLPDGRHDEAVVTLAMLIDTAHPRLSFFICHQHRPEFVWVKEWQSHPNGAEAITEITYAAPDPASVRARFAAVWGEAALSVETGGFRVTTAGGAIRVQTHTVAEARFAGVPMPVGWSEEPRAVALRVRVPDLERLGAILKRNGVRGQMQGDRVVVGPPYSGNIILEFAV
jgi:hypothetical protein